MSRFFPLQRPHNWSLRPSTDDGRGAIAAFLSFLMPGLGQAYNGQSLLGWIFAAPVLLVVAGVAIVVYAPDIDVLHHLLDTRFLLALIVLDVALFGWRVIAIAQAYTRQRGERRLSRTAWLPVVLLLLVAVMHGIPALVAVKAIDTLGSVALGGQGGHSNPGTAFVDSQQSLPIPSTQPEVVAGERVTFLLVGVDSGFGRNHALTDTMLVVSIDPDGSSAMISVPRDLYGVPLRGGDTYDEKLNMLLSDARKDPDRFPAGGVGTLKEVIGDLLGIDIHYFAAINLTGFKEAIDAIGGVDITVAQAIADPVYSEDGFQEPGFYLEPGFYHMEGPMALAYVRSRHGPGDSDFTRAERQQELLTAIQDKLTAGNLLVSLPGLLDAVKNTIATDVPSDRIPALAAAIQGSDMSLLRRAVIQPPLVVPEEDPIAGYILRPDLEAIRGLADDLFATAAAGN